MKGYKKQFLDSIPRYVDDDWHQRRCRFVDVDDGLAVVRVDISPPRELFRVRFTSSGDAVVHLPDYHIAMSLPLVTAATYIHPIISNASSLSEYKRLYDFDPNDFTVTMTTCRPRHKVTISQRGGRLRFYGLCDEAWAAVHALGGSRPRCHEVRDCVLAAAQRHYRRCSLGWRVNTHIDAMCKLAALKKHLRSLRKQRDAMLKQMESYDCRMTTMSIRYIARKFPSIMALRRFILPAIVFVRQVPHLAILVPTSRVEVDISSLRVTAIHDDTDVCGDGSAHATKVFCVDTIAHGGKQYSWYAYVLATKVDGRWVTSRKVMVAVMARLPMSLLEEYEPNLQRFVIEVIAAIVGGGKR